MGPLLAGPRRRTNAFWLVAATVGVVMFSSAAPSPLYPVYQQLWGFSSAMLTVIFAVYAGALLLSLLTVGVLSDHVGRRPVIAGALACLIAAMIVFATAGGTSALLIARIVQGLATGAALGTLSAALADLQPSRRTGALVNSSAPFAGLAFGIAISALLVQYAPAPRQLVYELIAAALAVLAAGVITVVPETSRRAGFSSPMHVARVLTPRVSVPREVRAAFIGGVPALIATWALGGLILSLGSSIVAAQLGIANHAADGALLSGFFFATAAAGPIIGAIGRPVRRPASYAFLGAGVALQLVGSLTSSIAAYTAGVVIAGIGFSTAYAGVVGSLAHVPAHGRGRLFASLYVVCYLAFSVPAIVGGVAADSYGLGHTTTGYTLFVLLMVVLAAAALLRRRAAEAGPPPAAPGPGTEPESEPAKLAAVPDADATQDPGQTHHLSGDPGKRLLWWRDCATAGSRIPRPVQLCSRHRYRDSRG
jgi:MFS family permease